MELTQEILQELLDYDPLTGILKWKERDRKWFKTDGRHICWNKRYANTVAGAKFKPINNYTHYLCVKLFKKTHKAHRLIWLHQYGYLPNQIDHIDRDGTNNRLNNLRDVSGSINNHNRRVHRNNKSGVTGVCFNNFTQHWEAYKMVNKKNYRLGSFNTKNEAIKARLDFDRIT